METQLYHSGLQKVSITTFAFDYKHSGSAVYSRPVYPCYSRALLYYGKRVNCSAFVHHSYDLCPLSQNIAAAAAAAAAAVSTCGSLGQIAFMSCEIQADMAPTDSSLCLPRQRGHCDPGRVQYWIAFLKILNDEKWLGQTGTVEVGGGASNQ